MPFQNFRQVLSGGNGVDQHTAFALGVGQLHDGKPQRRFDSRLSLLPLLQGNTVVPKLPYRHAGIILLAALAEQVGRHSRMVYQPDALELVLRGPSAKGIEQEHRQCRSARQQIGGQGVFHRGLEQRREQRDIARQRAPRRLLDADIRSTHEVQRSQHQLYGKLRRSAQFLPQVTECISSLNLKLFILGHRECPLSCAGRWSRPADTQ